MGTADATGTRTPEEHRDPVEEASGVLDDALQLTHELRAALHDQLCLVSNEAQLAARSFTVMVAAAVGIGVLLVSAWLGLMTAGTFALIGLGLAPIVTMLIGVAFNLAAVLVPYTVIRRKSRNLTFPATRRTMQPAASPSARGGDVVRGGDLERKAS
jgi:hypothetical protein